MIARPKTILAAFAAAAMLSFAGAAQAEQQTFAKPMHAAGYRLDWCVGWATDCGKPAADLYCKQHGFTHATGYTKAVDIGKKVRTRLIGTAAICDQDFCDGFGQITCAKPSANVHFTKPMHPAGNRLDWCFNWATGCGKQAADAFCKAKGHALGSINFSKAVDIGQQHKTRLIATGAVCDQQFCDGFAAITCKAN